MYGPTGVLADDVSVYDCSQNLLTVIHDHTHNVTLSLEGYDEKIIDGVGKNLPHGVSHSKRSYLVYDQAFPATVGNSGPTGTARHSNMQPNWVEYRKSALDALSSWSYLDLQPDAPLVPHRWNIVTSHLNESVLKEDVIEKAKGLVADHVLNAIEADQTWSLLQSAAKLLPYLSYHWSDIRKLYRDFRRKGIYSNANSAALAASNSLLAYQFGIKPLISDIKATIASTGSLQREIGKIKNQEPQRFSRVAKLPIQFDNTIQVDVRENGIDSWHRTFIGTVVSDPTVRYVLVVKPKVAYNTQLFAELATLARRFSTSPASLAWEKIPFSFVADWFVDLRGSLRAIDNILGVSPYEVISFTRSYSYEIISTVHHKGLNPCNGQLLYDDPAGTVQFKHYERSVVSDEPSWPVWKPKFGKTQLAETAALITQQLQKIR
jgi:hypothetical protein